MEKKYRLLILSIIIILSVSLVNAISISAPNQVDLNENFNLKIYGSGFYALELKIPPSFEIVSDISDGRRKGDLYKTFTSGNLDITLRPTKTGTYTISGEYTSGEGIKDLNSETIKVNERIIPPSCPICKEDSEWSNCEDGKQIRLIYICSSTTDYICVQSTETKSCEIEEQQIICEYGWVCKDKYNLAYQSSDCSFSSIQKCFNGCENNSCKISEDVNKDYLKENLTIKIKEEGKQETPQSIFDKIIKFIIKIIDTLIFWD